MGHNVGQQEELSDGFEDVPASSIDWYSQLQKDYPKIGFTSGFRTPEYQEDMKKRGYKPSDNSKHLAGDSIDINSFPGMNLAQGAAQLRKRYPQANVLYGDKNHKDHVHLTFPGYGGFPSLGGARDAGIINPVDELPEGAFEDVTEADIQVQGMQEGAKAPVQAGLAPEMRGGQPIGTEITFGRSDSNDVWDRANWIKNKYNVTEDQETQIVAFWNQNKGNPSLGLTDLDAFYESVGAPRPDRAYLTPEKIAEWNRGEVNKYGGFDDTADKTAYEEGLRSQIEAGTDTGSQGDYASTIGQGLTMWSADELEGIKNGFESLADGKGFVGGYEEGRNLERMKNRIAHENLGWKAIVAEMVGSLPLAFVLPLSSARSAAGLAGSGAISGAISGFNAGDGFQDSMAGAALEGTIGAVAGPVLGKVMDMAGTAAGKAFRKNPTEAGKKVWTGNKLEIYGANTNTEEAGMYQMIYVTKDGEKISIQMDVEDGVAHLDIHGEDGYTTKSINQLGAEEIIELSSQVSDALPHIKLMGGTRVTGSHAAAGRVGEEAEAWINLERMRNRSSYKNREDSGVRSQPVADLEAVDPFPYDARAWADDWEAPDYDPDPRLAEGEAVWNRRYENARQSGLYHDDARRLADEEYDLWVENNPSDDMGLADQRPPLNTADAGPERTTFRNGDEAPEPPPRADETPDPPGVDPEDTRPAVEKLAEALDEAVPLREAQDRVTREARAVAWARVQGVQSSQGGERGFFSSLSQLSGDLPKIEVASIRDRFTQQDLDDLYDIIRLSDLDASDTLNASKSLAKLLGVDGMGIPSEKELELLRKVLPEDVVNAIGRLRPMNSKGRSAFTNAINLPRAMMSTMDLSAPLRQGIFAVGRKEYWKNWSTMFKTFGSEETYQAVMDSIKTHPNYKLMEEHGLAITDLEGSLAMREEDFMSNWAEKIPIFGRGARASNRAYTAFLSKLRADLFNNMLENAKRTNPEFMDIDKNMKSLAGYVNNATGRGSLGGYEASAPLLNGLFFSPRLISARVQLLNPVYYMGLPPEIRREAIRDLASFGTLTASILTVAKMNGAEVEMDPRSSNFAKIKLGDTRYDILGGFQQYIKLATVLATGTQKNAKGEVKTLGEGYKADTRLDVLEKFFYSKFSPVASYVRDALKGEDFLGEPFDPVMGAVERFVPMFIGDTIEAIEKEGAVGIPKMVPAFFGVGVNTYPTPTDAFGNKVETGGKDDAVYDSIESLGNLSEVISNPSKAIKVDGEKITDEQYEEYKSLSGKYIYDDLADFLLENPDFPKWTNEEKKEVIDDIKKAARKDARADITPVQEELPEGFE